MPACIFLWLHAKIKNTFWTCVFAFDLLTVYTSILHADVPVICIFALKFSCKIQRMMLNSTNILIACSVSVSALLSALGKRESRFSFPMAPSQILLYCRLEYRFVFILSKTYWTTIYICVCEHAHVRSCVCENNAARSKTRNILDAFSLCQKQKITAIVSLVEGITTMPKTTRPVTLVILRINPCDKLCEYIKSKLFWYLFTLLSLH